MKKKIIVDKVRKKKYGKVVISNHSLEDHEKDTLFRLASFGFNVETITPSNIPHSNNPDILMLGTFWEMKGQVSSNKKTIKTKFRKAVKQSGGRAIFDLCSIKGDTGETEEFIIDLLKSTRGMKRVIILRNNKKSKEELIDIIK